MIRVVSHRAAEPEDLIQRCADCGEVLIDYTNTMSTGEWRPSWWDGVITIVYGNPKMTSAGADPDVMPCTRKVQ